MLNQHQTNLDLIARYNKPNQLIGELIPLLEGKSEARIADIGSGPMSRIGTYLDGVNLTVYSFDNQDFNNFWQKYQAVPYIGVRPQNMEDLNLPSDYFDIVHCANALDHTKNALVAVREMIRICKAGGYVYITCHLDQMDTGHKHYWNAKADGTFTNGEESFDLEDFGFEIQVIDRGGETRYNQIIAVLKK